ncbi:fatty acid--CoA ligase [Antrihabitans stalactiti]|uniref:Fatty acid--CoA ligase n=1 Tax=Antrihabitans stalactiti TaxID=2584121 RepID=A0A848KJF0_9NOCA|nr:fatty acid--CoA ligase [Antrihabitans stalactiti]NMN98399.1 fatty acid--CoA ligase [Antrihabitans stalactiti]
MDATMQDTQLLVSGLFEHGARVHPEARVHHYRGGETVSRTFAESADEVRRLASALRAIGVQVGDVVATLCWNTPEHLSAYFAVPGMGAVLHTLNLRLHDDQLVYVVNHAGDKVILVDADLVPQFARIEHLLVTVEHIVVIGDAEMSSTRSTIHSYAELIASASAATTFDWPDISESSAAALCYTSGTTGDPKGVAYSHRSMVLHTLVVSTGSAFGFTDADRILPVVPMFHANAWGWPHAAWTAGADIVMTGRFLQPEHLARIFTELQPTAAAAVPTIWTGLDDYGCEHAIDFGSLRLAVSGGSPLSAALANRFHEHHGVHLTQGWGMTETSPLLTFSRPPANTDEGDFARWTTRTGRLIPTVQARIVDETGHELGWDGVSVGEVELRGPTIAGSYMRAEGSATDKFRDGWLRTGDLGRIHPGGWVELTDRLKDGIKSGGEWISSVDLENVLAEHPAVAAVAVVGVPDPRWDERPLAYVVTRPGATVGDHELRAFLADRVAKWQIPEYWKFVTELPLTSVGKLDKKLLRAAVRAELSV